MNSARVAAERAASSAPSSSPSRAAALSWTTPAAGQTQALEALRQAKLFLQSDRALPRASSSADISFGHTEPSPDPHASPPISVQADDNVQDLCDGKLADTLRQSTKSTSQSCGNAQSCSSRGTTQSRGASGSSGGLTRTSAGGAATSPSPTSVSTVHSEAQQEKEVFVTGNDCPSSVCPDPPSPLFSTAPPLQEPEPSFTSSSTACSPDVQPPPLAALPFPSPSTRNRHSQLQRQQERTQQKHREQQHVQFDRPIGTPKAPGAPPLHTAEAPCTATPSPPISAADLFAVDLLRDLSYEEVQEVQECLFTGGRPRHTWMGPGCASLVRTTDPTVTDPVMIEDVGRATALLEAAPVSLNAEEALRFSRFFRASLMESDDEDEWMSDDKHDAVDTKDQEGVGTRERATVTVVGNRWGGTGSEHPRVEASSPSCPCSDTLPAPSLCALNKAAGAAADAQADEVDDLTLSSITGVSPWSRCPRHPNGDADGIDDAALPGLSILLSPPLQPVNTKRQIDRPPSPAPSEREVRNPPRHSLLPAAVATPWSLLNFDIGRRIGQGHSGKTFLAREKRSQVVVALKVFDKESVRRHDGGARLFKRGVRLQKAAGRHCSHIVKLYAFFTDARHCYTALEYVDGGDLASYLHRQRQQRLPEAQVRSIVYQLVLALEYLHERRVVHRAVTGRNVLLHHGETSTGVKLGDFAFAVQLPEGHSRWLGKLESSLDQKFSVDYAAPEVVRGHGWSCKSDMWALGVLVFKMLWGYHPFDHVSSTGTKRLICSGAALYSAHSLSHTGMSFVRSLLCVDEAARSSAAAALAHPFLAATAATAAATAPVCAVLDAAASRRTQSSEPPVRASSKRRTVSKESCVGAEAQPVNRDLLSTFSLAAVRTNTDVDRSTSGGHRPVTTALSTGTKTALHCGDPISIFPTLAVDTADHHCGEAALLCSYTTASSPPSATSLSGTGGLARASKHTDGGTWHTTDRVASTGSLSSASCLAPFMSFALPTHSLQSIARPSSAAPSTASHSGAPSNEEAGTLLGHRLGGASSRSAGPTGRVSPTRTLSDTSASFLSTTRPPSTPALGASPAPWCAFTGTAAAHVVPSSGFGDTNTENAYAVQPQPHRLSHRWRHEQHEPLVGCIDDDTSRGCVSRNSEDHQGCSVTVSTLTASPPRGVCAEWANDGAEVTVSSSTASSALSSSIRGETRRGGLLYVP
ncbi:hypothetical protein JKF63_04299 [Porcisia hertigi]|uniref:Protein kinase domain-containing protein n=1 Tax=Porcisia hertigi TaxID=2761500 RepID=A0A836IBF5_9TRYP|nr:hypothetical protein JKF63_04299 [Porcisia hertigi]